MKEFFGILPGADFLCVGRTYFYTPAGELVRKESYVEGEELKIGINIEEHVFNDKGVEIQSFTYNSLDPSSKLYTENEVDENGKTLAAFDESGEHTNAETVTATMADKTEVTTTKNAQQDIIARPWLFILFNY